MTMADQSKIEWTDATWNPVTGCSVVSPGCTNCYAMRLAGTRLKHHPSRAGLTRDSKAGPVWNGTVRFNEEWLTQPLQWKRPRMVFVCAHGDLFHEDVPDAWIDQVFAVMALSPQHTFQVLTKRAARMRAYIEEVIASGRWLLWKHPQFGHDIFDPFAAQWHIMMRKVWLGVSAEDQRRADERVPDLLATPAGVRFVSAEPLLGPIDFNRIPMPQDEDRECSALYGHEIAGMVGNAIGWIPQLDWIIVGGEAGRGARPMHPDWARQIRDQCAKAGTKFFFKQWGDWRSGIVARDGDLGRFAVHWSHNQGRWSYFDYGPRQLMMFGSDARMTLVGKKAAGRRLDGVEHNAMPRAA